MKTDVKYDEDKPIANVIGEDGNVFNLIGICSRSLKRAGQCAKAKEMAKRCMQCHSYEDALCVMAEYCDLQ